MTRTAPGASAAPRPRALDERPPASGLSKLVVWIALALILDGLVVLGIVTALH